MKKIISTLLVCVLLIGCVMTFASCNKLSGKYENTTLGVTTTLEFDGDTVKTSAMGFSVEGTYEIDDDKITITYEENGKTISETTSFEKGKDFILIDDVKYEKVD